MIKKDYILIAATIRAVKHQLINEYHERSDADSCFNMDKCRGINRLISELSINFSQENPKFDRNKFVAACEV